MSKLASEYRSPLPDVLRVVLCFGVTFYHFTPVRPSSGSFMVLGFLVLSGFLLGVYFERVKEFATEKFYSGKARRLLPMFVVSMLFGVVVKLVCYLALPAKFPLLPAFSLSEWGNFSLAKFLAFYNAPSWFMVTEFFMLLCAPVLYLVYKKRGGVFLLLLASMGMSWFLYMQVPYSSDHGCGLYYSPLVRSWQFIAGLAAARGLTLCGNNGSAVRKAVADVSCVLLSLVFVLASVAVMTFKQDADLHFWNFTFDFDVLVVLMYSLLIPLLYSRRVNVGERTCRVLTYMAYLTYPVYLIHVPLYLLCVGALKVLLGEDVSNICTMSVAVVGMLLVSAVLMRMQKKWFA